MRCSNTSPLTPQSKTEIDVPEQSLTQDLLRELFDYNPETGLLTNRFDRTNVCKEDPVGSDHGDGYLCVGINNRIYYLHRLVWMYVNGEFPPHEIDHINGIRDDNRIDNLRAVTRLENQRNQKLRVTNKSGVNGVSWDKKMNKWKACVSVKGKTVNLGHFVRKGDAILARRIANEKYAFHKNHGIRTA